MKRFFTVFAVVLLVIAVITGAAVFYVTSSMKSGNSSMLSGGEKPKLPSVAEEATQAVPDTQQAEPTENTVYLGDPEPDAGVILPEADVYYKGGAYNFNGDIATLLVMGVDKESDESGEHQADVIFLAAINDSEKVVDIIAVSRNTMTEVAVQNADGTSRSYGEMQLCRSYCYGKDDEQSSRITMDAVSKLFYGLPLNTYFTLFEDALPLIVDDIGTVTVTVDEDMTHYDSRYVKGATLVLDGKEALHYLSARNDTNTTRVSRQIDFLRKFGEKAKSAFMKNPALALKIYSNISKKSSTNISAANIMYLADAAMNYTINPLVNLTGTSGEFNGTEALYVDNTALYELILDIFYTKVG